MKQLNKFYLYFLGLPKTLLFNFYYFPLGVAFKLPVFVSDRVWLKEMSGQVEITNPRTGMVQIGFGDVGIFDSINARSIWQVSGKVCFKGRARLGHGNKISVAGKLSLGDDFAMTAESAIIAKESVEIGDRVLISWDVLIMDTDFHQICEMDSGKQINLNKPVKIGNSVWIGCRSMILKGVEMADNVVVAAGSTISRSVGSQNAIVGGSPTHVIKNNITWKI